MRSQLPIPGLAELDAAAVRCEPQHEDPRQRPLALLSRGVGRPPLDRHAFAVDDRPAHSHTRLGLRRRRVRPVGADPVPADMRVPERGGAVDGVFGEERGGRVGVAGFPGAPVALEPRFDVAQEIDQVSPA